MRVVSKKKPKQNANESVTVVTNFLSNGTERKFSLCSRHWQTEILYIHSMLDTDSNIYAQLLNSESTYLKQYLQINQTLPKSMFRV